MNPLLWFLVLFILLTGGFGLTGNYYYGGGAGVLLVIVLVLLALGHL